MKHRDLYSFVYRAILTEEALDKAGRRRRSQFGTDESLAIEKSLSYDFLDTDRLTEARRMSIIYAAIHAFENSVRDMVTKAMAETHKEKWWSHVPDKVQRKVKTRMEEDAKFRWHGARGATEINYCDFGDLSAIIVTNQSSFEDLLGSVEWAKGILQILEKSRNIVMHGGLLVREDVERIGVNIRDWIRQAG
ncbi:MAG TPA: Swt1 family HEPN domain-containing protein [Chthoniobacterales bacterium]|nr:Swt1 family HEPN domain-containing protein [Chthoniobacterales bacterium]